MIDFCLLIKGSVIGYQHKTNPFERILDTGVLAFFSKYFGASPTAGGRRPTREGGSKHSPHMNGGSKSPGDPLPFLRHSS